jgi:hypothetical protein
MSPTINRLSSVIAATLFLSAPAAAGSLFVTHILSVLAGIALYAAVAGWRF